MNELKIFQNEAFGQVRVIIRDGEPWFVASDVAKALGYSDPSRAVIQHCKKSVKSTILVNGQDGKRVPLNQNLVPESDVYRLIMRSNLPRAEEFQTWVCEDVLPSIRKTGSYSMQTKLPDFSNPAEAARAWADEYEAKCHALEEAAQAREDRDTALAMLGFAENWKQVKGIPWLKEYFELTPVAYQQIGRTLSVMSRARGVEIKDAPDPTYGTVHVYHESVIAEMLTLLQTNPDFLRPYRKQ